MAQHTVNPRSFKFHFDLIGQFVCQTPILYPQLVQATVLSHFY